MPGDNERQDATGATPVPTATTVGPPSISADALDSMLDAVMVFDLEGVIVFANRAFSRLLERDLAELVGQRIRALLPANLRDAHVERRKRYVQAPVPQQMGERPVALMERKDGTAFPVEFSLAPFETATGSYVTAMIREVSPTAGRMGGERHLAMSERAARMGSWEEDARTGQIQWSQGMHDLLGLPRATVTPSVEAFLSRVHPDDLPRVLAQRERARTEGGEWFVEARMITAGDPAGAGQDDGTPDQITAVSILGSVEIDADHRVHASTGTVQDISARVVLERQLHASNARLQAAFDGAPIGVALIDARPGHPPRRLIANQALADLTGMTVAELLERPVLDSIDPRDQGWFGAVIRQVATGELASVQSLEARLARPDGQQRWVSSNGSLVRDAEGRPAYIVAHMVDITDRKLAEASTEQRAARDARIASILQDGLRPDVPRRVGPLKVASRYQPAGTGELVGGDWTDVFALPGGRIGIVVGDVAGHGIEAAATMTRLRALVRMLATSGTSPAGVMRRLNDVMHESDVRADIDLATLVHAQLDPATGMLLYCSAGHLPMLVLPTQRAPYRRIVTPIPAIGGPPIGVVAGLKYTQETLALEPGSTLIGYTDGLVERRGHDIDQSLLTLQNGVNVLPESTLNDVETLADAILALPGTGPRDDDIAVNFDPHPTPDLSGQAPSRTNLPRTHDESSSRAAHDTPDAHIDLDDFAIPPNRWTRT